MDLPDETIDDLKDIAAPVEPAKTPGQVAYEAYFDAVGGRSYDGHALQSWEGLNHVPAVRNAWEAGAQAVIAAYGPDRSKA